MARASAEQRQRMMQLVHEWEASGEPRRAFAARHGLTVSQFDYWKQQRRQRPRPAAPAVGFAPVQVVEVAEGGSGAALELQLASGDRLIIPAAVSVERVRAVVTALRAPC